MKKNKIKKEEENLVKAINKNVRSSTRKITPILRGIVGKKVDHAIRDLTFSRVDKKKDRYNQIYDDPHLYWIILKMNDIVNVNEDWPKTQRQLNKFVDNKYQGKALMVSGMGTSDFTIGEDVTTIEGYISLEDFFDTTADSEPRLKYERSDVENYMVQEAIDNPATGIISSIDKTNFNIGSKTNPTHKVVITEADGTFTSGDVITGRNSDTTATIISTVANTDSDHHFEDEDENY